MSAVPAGSTDVDTSLRIRLALAPRFLADVLELDDEESVRNLYTPCAVDGCLRSRQLHGLCTTHAERWRKRGRPHLDVILTDPGPPTRPERIRLGHISRGVSDEIALALQLALGTRGTRPQIIPRDVQRFADVVQERDLPSMLSEDETWVQSLPKPLRRAHTALRRRLEDFLAPTDATAEFERDVWRLRVMGHVGRSGANGRLRFDGVPQPWLRHLVKRFMRWRIATGRSYHQLNRDITALQRLADAFTDQAGPDAGVVDFTRGTIEAYLARLVQLGLREASRSYEISSVSTFLRTVRQHDWQPDLSHSAGVFPGDYPRRPAALPRALPEFVMAQIESPEALAQLEQPHRLMMEILIGTGLRLTDAYRLAVDCLVRDAQGAPYLRYRNHKMKREAMVPIDDQLAAAIDHQVHAATELNPDATPLAPGPGSRDGGRPWSSGPVTTRINAWQEAVGLRDENGRPFRFTAHQLGTSTAPD